MSKVQVISAVQQNTKQSLTVKIELKLKRRVVSKRKE
jgi:hypothetical protein